MAKKARTKVTRYLLTRQKRKPMSLANYALVTGDSRVRRHQDGDYWIVNRGVGKAIDTFCPILWEKVMGLRLKCGTKRMVKVTRTAGSCTWEWDKERKDGK